MIVYTKKVQPDFLRFFLKSAMNHFFLFFMMLLVLNVVTNLLPKTRFKTIQTELNAHFQNNTYRRWEYMV